VPLSSSMGTSLKNSPCGRLKEVLGRHLAPMQPDITPRLCNDYEIVYSLAEVMVLVSSHMRRRRTRPSYKLVSLPKYLSIWILNYPSSWPGMSIMSSLSSRRGWPSRGFESRATCMAVEVPLYSLGRTLCHLPEVLLLICEVRPIAGYQVCAGESWPSPSRPLPAMAPKRECPSPPPSGQNRPLTRKASREENRAAQAAHYFKSNFPQEIQAEIEKVEQLIWEENKGGIPEADFKNLAACIHDPGSTYGRVTLYQRAISYFWAAKCIAARSIIAQKPTTPKGLAPAPLWNHHFNETRLMHRKLDLIAGRLGVQFAAPEAVLTPQARPRAAAAPDPQASHAPVP